MRHQQKQFEYMKVPNEQKHINTKCGNKKKTKNKNKTKKKRVEVVLLVLNLNRMEILMVL